MSDQNRPLTVFRPTVVIGLGGTGYRTLLEFKSRLIQVYGEVPPLIRLLSIDTTEDPEKLKLIGEGIKVKLSPDEQLLISISNPSIVTRQENVKEWWPSEITPGSLTRGAGQIRARGRLGLFAESRKIYSAIREAISKVKNIKSQKLAFDKQYDVSNSGGVEVFIVGSLAGGTGSGTFLDIAYMARNEAINDYMSITGLFALPRVFENVPANQNVKSNAYGALKEIEYFGHGRPIEINYGSLKIETEYPPFDLVFLIDGVNEAGKYVSEPSQLQNLMADGLFVLTASQISVEADNVIDNLKNNLGHKVGGGKFLVNYCSFGVSSLVLPLGNLEHLKRQDAYNLIKEDLLGTLDLPNDFNNIINDLLDRFGLQERKLGESLISDSVKGMPLNIDFKVAGIALNKGADLQLQNKFRNDFNSIERKVALSISSNYGQILNSTTQSITEWWKYTVSQRNGLHYCDELLPKIMSRLDDERLKYQKVAADSEKTRKSIHSDQLEKKLVAVKNTVNAFIQNKDKFNRACDDYGNSCTSHNKSYLHSKKHEKIAELLGEIYSLFEALIEKQKEIRRLINVVSQRLEQDIRTYKKDNIDSNIFVHKMQRFDIGTMKPKSGYDRFANWQRDRDRFVFDWVNMKTEDLRNEVDTYIDHLYHSLSDLSVEEALRQSPTDLAAEDIRQIWDLACPLWNFDKNKISNDDHGTMESMSYIGTFNREDTVLNNPDIEQGLPHDAFNKNTVSTGDPNRITVVRIGSGVPLFALQGIEEMKQHYDKATSFQHLHKDWASLPDLLPVKQEDDEKLRCFAIGMSLGIIRRSLGKYIIDDDSKTTLGENRPSAFNKFKQSRELFNFVKEKIDRGFQEKASIGTDDAVVSILQNTVQEMRRQLSGKLEAKTIQQMQLEIEVLERYVDKITTIS